MKTNPPKLFLRFFRWYAHPKLREHIEGDLIQEFLENVDNKGKRKADVKFIIDVLLLFRPSIIKPIEGYKNLNNYGMIKSYFKIAIRVIVRHKFYSAINVFGLTIGLAFALLMGIFIYSELQVNQQLKNIDRLYMIEGKTPDFNIMVPSRLSQSAIEKYPTLFENYYRFWDRSITISKGTEHYRMDSMIGDSTFVSMFGFQILYGNPTTALTELNSIAITENVAIQFFNRKDVVGETLTMSTERSGLKDFTIAAVVSNLPAKNSVTNLANMRAQVFLSLKNVLDILPQEDPDSWGGIISYVKLLPNVTKSEATQTLNKIIKQDAPKNIAETMTVQLAPLKDYYLQGSTKQLVVSLSLVIVFILLLAITNFINITIASSLSRLKEVGVRKVVGGLKRQVITQHILESLIVTFIASACALIVYQLAYIYVGQLLESPLPPLVQFQIKFWLAIIASIFFIGIVAGAYPSFYLSINKPIESLKGKFKSNQRTNYFARAIIVVQFSVTIFIFIAAAIITRQVDFFLTRDMGFDKSSVLIVNSVPRIFSDEGFQKTETAKQEFLKSSKVTAASLSWAVPCWNFMFGGGRIYTEGKSVEQGVNTLIDGTDEDYLNVFKIKLLEGNYFKSDGVGRKPNSLVINQTAQKALGVTVGEKVRIENFDGEFIIEGIMNDFHFESLQEQMKPLAFMHYRDLRVYRYFSFKLAPGNLTESVQEIESVWRKQFPNDPFVFDFADHRVAMAYKTETQLRKASTLATFLMIAIVVTGVLGLVSLSISKRSKEIGIRKVLGASVSNILALVTREYVWMIVLASALATPLSYCFATVWLQGFAFHINLTWWMFAIPLFAVLFLTILIVTLNSLKTSLANPVRSLKSE